MKFITECLRRGSSVSDPDQSIKDILAYLGGTVLCDRVYIFEFEKNVVHNTYEWCRDGVMPQKEILQHVSTNDIESWMKEFRLNKDVTIRDLEEIKVKTPALYAILKPQNIFSLAVVPIYECENMIGFFGVDNPDPDRLTLITPLLKVIGYYLVLLLKQRNLKRNLDILKIRDELTGAFNRTALYDRRLILEQASTLGVIYCDVTGLKENNGLLGTEEGDKLLQKCYQIIREKLNVTSIYRVNGDEFAVVYTNISEPSFMEKVNRFEKQIKKENHIITMGYSWSDKRPCSLDAVMLQAERSMREKIYRFYLENGNELLAERKAAQLAADKEILAETEFYQFLKHYYYDPEQVFHSITHHNTSSYFYFGDLQKDVFYISDNMRDEFGFQGNIVHQFLRAWEYRIVSEKSRELYRKDHETLLNEKRTIHDLRYQVRDIRGKVMWVRCYGILKWNEDKTKPLFFSGRITHQDNEFVIDPVTNFPRSSVMIRRLDSMKEKGETVRAIGFSFNCVSEINSTKGRSYSDSLVHSIAEELMNCLSNRMLFYRLEGMKCVAVFEQNCKDQKDDIVKQIKYIVTKWYRKKGIDIQTPCSFAYMEYSDPLVDPTDFIEQMIDMIRVAKRDGTSNYIEYAEDSIEKAKRMSCMSLALSRDVLHGMQNFRVMIQPVIKRENGEIYGGEILLRWKYNGKDISPSEFIPIMEKENIIHVAGRWVFEKAVCTQLRISSYKKDFYVAFNISIDQLADLKFADYMGEILKKYNVDGKHLVAEMTENCMDEHPEKMTEFVRLCHDLGIRIALDDFGNGYSSLRRLLKYPSSIIKLDRSIMREMMKSEDKKNFIASIVYACHSFGKKVCMEGVETAEQNSMITDSECDMIQGYYHYKPLEINEMYSLLATL